MFNFGFNAFLIVTQKYIFCSHKQGKNYQLFFSLIMNLQKQLNNL